MILVDFKDIDIRRCPCRKRDANVKINPLANPWPIGEVAMSGKSPSLDIVEQMIAGWQALDGQAVAACFTEDGVWHNMPYAPIAGRDAIAVAVGRFLSGMTACRFEVLHSGETAEGVVMNERVDIFTRTDGHEQRFAVAGVFEVQAGLIRNWRDYFDSAIMSQA